MRLEGRQGPGRRPGKITFTLADVTAPVVDQDDAQRPNGPDSVQQGTRPDTVTLAEHLRDPQGTRDDLAAVDGELLELHQSQ